MAGDCGIAEEPYFARIMDQDSFGKLDKKYQADHREKSVPYSVLVSLSDPIPGSKCRNGRVWGYQANTLYMVRAERSTSIKLPKTKDCRE